jgi:hypothetical protein
MRANARTTPPLNRSQQFIDKSAGFNPSNQHDDAEVQHCGFSLLGQLAGSITARFRDNT